MKITACASLLLVLIGCTSAPKPDSQHAAAQIHVIAQPKAGVKESFVHVPVYDAAPVPAKASGTYERVDYSRLDNIIVWLQPEKMTPHLGQLPLIVKINSTKPATVIHVASIGQPLLLENAMSQRLKLYSVSEGNEFDLPEIAPSNFDDSFSGKTEGLVEVLYDPAQPPIAQIYFAPSPWVARARSGETITFNNVPPGEYKVIAWHPRLPSATSNTSLHAGQVTKTSIAIGVDALSDSSP